MLPASVPFVTILGSKTKIGYEHESWKPVTLRRTHAVPTGYPGWHREQVEALGAK